MSETNKFDVAVVGGGHNGLVCANYLARAGLKVVVLEARHVVGGACVSEELVPNSTWSSASFIQGMLRPEVIADLELAKYGLVSRSPAAQGFFALWRDGDHVMLWKELDRTLASIERHSPGDGENFLRFAARLKRFGDVTRDVLLSEPPSRSEFIKLFEDEGEQELLQEFVFSSAAALTAKYIRSERLQGYMMFLGMVSTWGGPSTPGTSYVYGYHAQGEYDGVIGRWALPVGGMGAITRALAAGAMAHGAVIRTSAPVESVLVRGNKAVGVALRSGEEFEAGLVVSGADPKRSLTKFLDPKLLPDRVRAAAERIDQRGSMARIHLLVDELPNYSGMGDGPGPHHATHTILGGSGELYERAWEAQRRGTFAEEYVIEALIQSVTDPSVAPEGQHTLSLGVQQLPFDLAEGTWDDHKEAWADRVVETYCTYAPNIRNHILGRCVLSPRDWETDYNLTGGNIFQASMVGLDQLMDARPLWACGHYRTPVTNYYMCGAGTHPGGGVTGAPGHNAAMRILADLKGERSVRQVRTRAGGKTIVDSIMETDFGQKFGYQVARSRGLRSITNAFSKTKR